MGVDDGGKSIAIFPDCGRPSTELHARGEAQMLRDLLMLDAYHAAAKEYLPSAVQVMDCFHVMKNLNDALQGPP
jgi:hypothetical protein